MIDLRTATPETTPLVDPALFAATVTMVLEQHVKPGSVHEPDFYFFRDVPSDAVICDVGANLGLSVVSIRAVGADPVIHSFEMNPALWPNLKTVATAVSAKWRLHPVGLSDADSEEWIYIVKADDLYIIGEATMRLDFLQMPDSIARLLSYTVRGELSVGRFRASMRRFDGLAVRPDYLKIDAEGAEVQVLKGMADALSTWRPVLMIENSFPADVDDLLSTFAYRPYNYDAGSHSLTLRDADHSQNSFYLHRETPRSRLAGVTVNE
jgi:FkbM family methyltransferase